MQQIEEPFDTAGYTAAWLDYFGAHGNPALAVPMAAYLKNQFEILGIKATPRRTLAKEFHQMVGLPPFGALPETVRALWALPYREAHYFGMELPLKYKKQWTPDLLPLFEEMVLRNSWWDTVDHIASNLLGACLFRFPEEKERWVRRWIASNNFWLNRTAIIFQLRYKEETDWELMQDAMLPHLQSKEFFIQKAIGWALRQYARQEPQRVLAFVDAQPLASLSRREALKHFK